MCGVKIERKGSVMGYVKAAGCMVGDVEGVRVRDRSKEVETAEFEIRDISEGN